MSLNPDYQPGFTRRISILDTKLSSFAKFRMVCRELESNQDNENNSIDNVTTVTDDVIEIIKDPPWS